MLLQEPQRTPYDLDFRLLGFPVRVHPGFFLLPVLFGGGWARGAEINAGLIVLIFVLVFFVSILVHEMGHAVAFRRYGIQSRIVLYWLGGLAIPEAGWGRRPGLGAGQQILVSAAGPAAGFLLAALLCLSVLGLGGQLSTTMNGIMPVVITDLRETALQGNQAMFLFFQISIYCNIFWNILNLAPVVPLDGGKISTELFQHFNRHQGVRNALLLSAVAAGLIAVAGFASDSMFLGLFFAILGISSYLTLQQMSRFGGGGF